MLLFRYLFWSDQVWVPGSAHFLVVRPTHHPAVPTAPPFWPPHLFSADPGTAPAHGEPALAKATGHDQDEVNIPCEPLPVTSSFFGDFNGFHQEFCELEPTHKGASVESWGAWANAPTCFLASTLILVQQMDSVLPATRRRDPFCHCKGERPVRKRMFSA